MRMCDVKNLVKPDGDLLLDSCPFCGGTENLRYILYEHVAGDRWAVGCLDCMAIIDPGWAQEKSVVRDMWNRRDRK